MEASPSLWRIWRLRGEDKMSKIHDGPHKYQKFIQKRITRNNVTIWRCMLPECNHHVYMPVLLIGRRSICWACGMPFVMSSRDTESKKSVCEDCKEKRKGKYAPIKKVS
jgi:hypothetical protein